MTTFLDTNIIIYLLDSKCAFHDWAKATAAKRRTAGPLLISDIVYSEISVNLESIEDTDAALDELAIERVRFSTMALFRAGRAYKEYRKRGGPRTSLLSDFLIGAQAEAEGVPLVTNNRCDFSSYFPRVELIVP